MFFCHFYSIFFCNFAELLKRLACEKLVFQQISFAKLEKANFTVCPLQEKSGRLQLTWWHIGEVAASQRFGRGSNFQICTTVSAGLLSLSRQYARCGQVFLVSISFLFCKNISTKRLINNNSIRNFI